MVGFIFTGNRQLYAGICQERRMVCGRRVIVDLRQNKSAAMPGASAISQNVNNATRGWRVRVRASVSVTTSHRFQSRVNPSTGR